jgi:hypothetical protein
MDGFALVGEGRVARDYEKLTFFASTDDLPRRTRRGRGYRALTAHPPITQSHMRSPNRGAGKQSQGQRKDFRGSTLLVGHSKRLGLPRSVSSHSNRVSANQILGFRETEFFDRRQRGQNIPGKFRETSLETIPTPISRPIGRQLPDGWETSMGVGMRGGGRSRGRTRLFPQNPW